MRITTRENLLFTGAILLQLFSTFVRSQSEQNGTDSQVFDNEKEPETSAIDDGMQPFYTMTKYFLDVIHPTTKAWIVEELGVKTVASYFKDNSDLDVLLKPYQEDWQRWAKQYIGFTICVAVGLVFVVVMPLCGLVFCCCRCCGKCGARAHKEAEGRRAKCTRLCCGTLLFIFTTLILAGTVLTFITNELLWEQTSEPEKGPLYQLQLSLNRLEDYKQNSLVEFDGIVNRVELEVQNTLSRVSGLPVTATQKLDEVVDATLIINRANDLARSAEVINSALTEVDTKTRRLRNSATVLDSRLTQLETNMTATLNGCPASLQSSCTNLGDKISGLNTVADFNQLDDVTFQLNKVRQVVSANLTGLIAQGEEDFKNISHTVEERIRQDVEEVRVAANEIITNSRVKVAELKMKVNEYVRFNDTIRDIQNLQEDMFEYGDYRKYVGIFCGCALLIVAILFFIGLLLGCCGEPPYEDASSCNRESGGNLLLGGVIWSFMFSWILMIIVVGLFVPGGLFYVDGCRHLVDLGDSDDSLRTLQLISDILNETGKIQSDDFKNVDFQKLILDCKKGYGLYEAMNLDQAGSSFDLDSALDLDQYGLRGYLNDLENAQITINNVQILKPETRTQLEQLRDSGLQDINFQTFYTEV